VIKCKVVIVWAAKDPLTIQDAEVDPPKAGEVRIHILHTCICHTDEYTRSGKDPEGTFPVILGHEGGGIIESVGEGVTDVQPIIFPTSFETPWLECKKWKFFTSGKTNLCSSVRSTQGRGVMPDGSVCFHWRGKDISISLMGVSSFSQYTVVVSQYSIVKVNPKVPLEKLSLLGRGDQTPGVVNFSIAVFGCGCIGLDVVNGARHLGNSHIIAIDTNLAREAWAFRLGATEFINSAALRRGVGSVQEHLVAITGRGLDLTNSLDQENDTKTETILFSIGQWSTRFLLHPPYWSHQHNAGALQVRS
ncbi:hypothetical protein BS47DRAFT_1301246, partial [Hydnum rufescens UP504]